MIEEKYQTLGFHDRKIDGPLRLVFAGRPLMDGKRLCDYPIEAKRRKWTSKPYVGIVWIVRFHIEPQTSFEWGSDSTVEDRRRNLETERPVKIDAKHTRPETPQRT